MIVTWLRMTLWPRPQSSVQITGNVPVRVGVTTIELCSPGTASCFCESCGTQNEWMTSFDVMSSFTWRPSGIVSEPYVLPFGYVNCQANCCATTLITRGFDPASPFLASTIALTIEIAVTSRAGIAVHTISSFVCPCVGGPSESSSGPARNFHTENASTAATTENTTIEMTVANQKTKWIRCASLPADTGSHGISTATAVQIAPATSASAVS